ncbi:MULTISPECIES: MerC domain-containing protein [unclassified Pseudoalteromonas]|uniref:MerC domain-containing protein n=1 Tax=unclassified Pseudoalteromonas TaxID=194690 RepID=UPI001109BDDD|nr:MULTISPECIES: MerC domain-containing protein [unclassified Pseudoalteromonas]TMN77202.1 MerC domain-containing protein [Pseudoalteromonas sp. S410]TMN87303.1 MerC domain-containing protein [Pseudoalteromonas sp. S408]TMN94467.1 MerC domain-containing protein [Pseudoalteromonas sp. S407]TMO01434.1 MerC domain-containing protein [Pseudoalteromonas sp. S409]TMO05836.1 MerC domain-containing protein [Pseudoalteromonas sp. S186]
MRSNQSVMDRLAIGLSVLCTVHCFATPILLSLLPSIGALKLNSEQFHFWILVAVIPTSLLALSLGCKKHRRLRYISFGVVGITLMLVAVTLGGSLFGEVGEKGFTLLGSAFVAVAHWFNYQQCLKKSDDNCPCSSTQAA